MHEILVSAVIGYLLGSIPFGYLLVRLFRDEDVRTTGSGNIGATNVARSSPLLGVATLFLDAMKGLAAVALVSTLYPDLKSMAFIAALAAICGHIFPLWLGFRGGKGVATGLGSFLLLTPKAVLVAIGIFLAVTAAFRWVALGSIIASASLPLAASALGEVPRIATAESAAAKPIFPILLMLAGSLLIILKHHSNIRRMLAGTEPRFGIPRK